MIAVWCCSSGVFLGLKDFFVSARFRRCLGPQNESETWMQFRRVGKWHCRCFFASISGVIERHFPFWSIFPMFFSGWFLGKKSSRPSNPHILPWKLTNVPWKSMVGRCIPYWNSPFLPPFPSPKLWSLIAPSSYNTNTPGLANAHILLHAITYTSPEGCRKDACISWKFGPDTRYFK